MKYVRYSRSAIEFSFSTSLSLVVLLLQDDPLVEYEDEFGRMRTARRSEVPRNLQPSQQEQVDDEYVLNACIGIGIL